VVGGWFVGLPLTSGPVAFFLALEYGTAFARDAAIGALGGTAAQGLFCLAYVWSAIRLAWPLALCTAFIAFAIGATLLQALALPLPFLLLAVVLILLMAVRVAPQNASTAIPLAPPVWDIPVRMAVATALVVILTGVALLLGPRLTGLLGTFPVFATVLIVFAQRTKGIAAAQQVVGGLLFGLFAFTAFFLIIAICIERAGITIAFASALALALAIQGATLTLVRRPGPRS
jgi:hypothetical protein